MTEKEITALIIDDEFQSRNYLSKLMLMTAPEVKLLGQAASGDEAFTAINDLNPQIVFLDIMLGNETGFDLLQRYPQLPFEVIFTTAFNEYAIRAFKFNALDYLLKPIDREELQRAVQKVIQRLHYPLPQQLEILLQKVYQPVSSIQKIALPTMEGLQMIAVNSIISCASDSNYTVFLLKNKQKLIVSRTLKEIEEMLEEYFFLRVHHSHLVNLNEVNKYIKGEGGYLIMSDDSAIDVSRSRKETLLKKLQPGRC